MSFEACAQIVERGDPDRFQAMLAAPVEMRRAMAAVFAFNIEVSRAPWVTQEPMIAEMRLQWWRDALEEIGDAKKVRTHEVTTELAAVLTPEAASLLDQLVEARRFDIERVPFANWSDFERYLRDTSGRLMGALGLCTKATPDAQSLIDYGGAAGLANWFRGYAQLKAQGGSGLPDDTPEVLAERATLALDAMGRTARHIPKAAYPIVRTSWPAAGILRTAAGKPSAIINGGLHNSEFRRRAGLMWRVLTNRI